MALKKPERAGASAKDIDSLFSRAGMIGAKYREFPRPESVSAVHPGVGLPAVSAPPRIPVTEPFPAAPPGWTPLQGIFADPPLGSCDPGPGQSGVKMAIVSLAGGVGKTTLAASLARTLSAQHRQVLLADGALFPTLPHHFGSRGRLLRGLQFLYPPAAADGLPVGMFRLALSEVCHSSFQDLLAQVETSDSFLLVDLPTFQNSASAQILSLVDHVLVPVTPDIHSVGSLQHLRQVFAAASSQSSGPQVHYLLNRFDDSQLLDHEIKGRLEDLLGDSLLSHLVHEDRLFEQASADGMTVVDYRPGSLAAAEIAALAEWLRQLSPHRHICQSGRAV